MIKLAACLLLIFLGGGAGIIISRRYEARVRQLEKCDMFLVRLKTYLGMEKITTKELFERLSKSECLSELIFLKKTADGLSHDINFPLIWQKSLSESEAELSLIKEDYQFLKSLSEIIGAYDVENQQNGIETSRSILKEQLKIAQEQNHRNGKLARSLGILSGITAAILIV